MDNRNKSIEYNTKVSQRDFDTLQTEREDRQKKQREMIESRFIGGTLSGLQERLRISKAPDESKVLKSQYKERDAENSASGINDSFKTRGVEKMEEIGYSNFEYYEAPENTAF